MSAEDTSPHPERLPWFADGRLEPAEAAAVETHLSSCDECRAEVDALRSMYRSLRASGPSDHISPARLVALHDGDRGVLEAERRLMLRHIQGCPACAADLSALDRAAASTRSRAAKRMMATAATGLIVVVLAWQVTGWRTRPGGDGTTHVVFPPAQRSAGASPRLTGRGPWVLEVWPPLRASAAYVARIERSDEPARAVFTAHVASSSPDGKVLVAVAGGLTPGHHILSLTPSPGSGAAVYARGFDVVTEP